MLIVHISVPGFQLSTIGARSNEADDLMKTLKELGVLRNPCQIGPCFQ